MQIGALIVDDNEDIRTILRLIIEQTNGDVFVSGEATGGREALDRIDALDPTVVVLDEMMPEMTGLECAALIRQRRPGQQMILCTAYLDERLRRAANSIGIEVCLTKTQLFDVPDAMRRVAAAGAA